MTTIEKLTADLTAAEAKVQSIREQLDALKPKEPWKPKDGESYYVPSSMGSVQGIWVDDMVGTFHWEQGWVFRTPEECTAFMDANATHVALRRAAGAAWAKIGMTEDDAWKDRDRVKCFVYLEADELYIGYNCSGYHPTVPYFPTKESLNDAIQSIGEDRVLRYLKARL